MKLTSNSLWYLGSNNTAELTAIGEALLWCLQYFRNANNTPAATIQRIVIRYDSEYAANSVQGIFNGKKNTELIAEVRKYYTALKQVILVGGSTRSEALEVDFSYVKGHSGARWNEYSDMLAGRGASGEACSTGRYAQNGVGETSNITNKESKISTASDLRTVTLDEGLRSDQRSYSGSALVLYTDGACIGNYALFIEFLFAFSILVPTHSHVNKGNKNVKVNNCPSGWGVMILTDGGDKGSKENEGNEVFKSVLMLMVNAPAECCVKGL